MRERAAMNSTPMDRRTFMGRIVVSASGAGVACLLPASLLQAGEACALVGASSWPDPCGDWTLDDICNAYPPYAFDIRRSVTTQAPLQALVADIDRLWVA
jgi:hypothetical protein